MARTWGRGVLLVLGGLLVVGVGAASGHLLTTRLFVEPVLLPALAEASDPRAAMARALPKLMREKKPAPRPAGTSAERAGVQCCAEDEPGHLRPSDLLLPTVGIHGSVARGDLEAVRRELTAGVSVDGTDGVGRTPLAIAVLAGRPQVLTALMDAGANLHLPDASKTSPVMLAAQYGDVKMIEMFAARGVKPAGANGFGQTPLMLAAMGNHALAAGLLLDHTPDINRRCDRGLTALMYAAARPGCEHVMEVLLDRGADREARDLRGATALAIAAENGQLDSVRLLLDGGAAIDAPNRMGLTPLGYAALKRPPGDPQALRFGQVAQLLATRGAEFDFGEDPDTLESIDWQMLAPLALSQGKALHRPREPAPPQPALAAAGGSALQLMKAVPRQDSRTLPSRIDNRITAFTRGHWRVVNVMRAVEVRGLRPWTGQRIVLAGDAHGSWKWSVDDALLIEAFRSGGSRVAANHLGILDELRVDHRKIEPRGGRHYTWYANGVDITSYFKGADRVVFTAVDWGGRALLSDIFLRVLGDDADKTLRDVKVTPL